MEKIYFVKNAYIEVEPGARYFHGDIKALYFVKNNKRKFELRSLAQLKNQINIDTEIEALNFVRLRTRFATRGLVPLKKIEKEIKIHKGTIFPASEPVFAYFLNKDARLLKYMNAKVHMISNRSFLINRYLLETKIKENFSMNFRKFPEDPYIYLPWKVQEVVSPSGGYIEIMRIKLPSIPKSIRWS